jgi:hypothetical protein
MATEEVLGFGGERKPIESPADELAGSPGYVIQRRLDRNAQLTAFFRATSMVRSRSCSPVMHRVGVKSATSNNPAHNFWCQVNPLSAIALETGLGAASCGGPVQR